MRSYAISFLMGLLFLLATPVSAYLPTPHIVDMTHCLELKTHDSLAIMLARAAKERGLNVTILIVNDDSVTNLPQYARRWVQEYELRLFKEAFLQKRLYLVVNARSEQAAILLGKEVILDKASQEGLQEIQQKILEPHLQHHRLNTAINLSVMAMLTALEEWPSKPQVQSSQLLAHTSISVLKWFALLGLGCALMMLLRILFYRPHWQELPLISEPSLDQDQQRSLEMAYWRSHLHIPEI